MNSNNIEEIPFGYFVDSTFIILGDSDLDYVDPSFDLEKINGGACFLDADLNKRDISVKSFYNCKAVKEHDGLYQVNYGDNFRPELKAIISEDGRIAVEACEYKLEDDQLHYTPCSPKGMGGIEFDADANPVVKTVSLK